MNTTKTDREIRAVCKDKMFWRKLKLRLLKLQKRIYRAFILGNIKVGRRLQKTLISSWSAKCLALKKAITKFKQKKIKFLPSLVIVNLAKDLKLNSNQRLALKPSSQLSQFKLVSDKALQILVLMAIEPEKQAKQQLKQKADSVWVFDDRDYSKRDIVKAVFNNICHQPQFLLKVKIKTNALYSDKSKLSRELKSFPRLNRQLKLWLKKEVAQTNKLFDKCIVDAKSERPSQTSFWLTKILVDRLFERAIEQFDLQLPEKLKIIKYHQEILLFNPDLMAIEQFQLLLWQCLQELELPLNYLQMSIVHTLNWHNNKQPGFNFLGFNFMQSSLGKHHSRQSHLGELLDFKTIVAPSKNEMKKHDWELAKLIDRLKAAPAEILISRLNTKLAKWTNYYSLLVEKELFDRRDRILFVKLWYWANYRHPRKSARFIWEKYWRKTVDRGWVFTANSSRSISVRLNSYAKFFEDKSTQLKRYVSEEPCEGKLSRTVL
jgi:RNA-directed DNA polymerase